ncbi:MAG: LAGLIDADG family homing endonuclease [Candidatus Liptonbacteria bacterium]|nr:LAGLIDADG family homing endonuclease [Candidatus Liptonbacteria bacterium]
MRKVKIVWSSRFAYAIGLITTDGNLSIDGRHINFTSKDEELVLIFKLCLGLSNRIGRKSRGGSKEKKYFVVQFGDRDFYDFLATIGLKPAKSKTLTELKIPKEYFADFFRGCIDGDGSIGFFSHPESKYPQLRIRLCSASPRFLEWVKSEIQNITKIEGGWIESKKDGIGVLVYAKADSLKLFSFMYYNQSVCKLSRKFAVTQRFYGRVAELV